jgi:hypothetical protein
MSAAQWRSLVAPCSAHRAEGNDSRGAAISGLTFRGKESTC